MSYIRGQEIFITGRLLNSNLSEGDQLTIQRGYQLQGQRYYDLVDDTGQVFREVHHSKINNRLAASQG